MCTGLQECAGVWLSVAACRPRLSVTGITGISTSYFYYILSGHFFLFFPSSAGKHYSSRVGPSGSPYLTVLCGTWLCPLKLAIRYSKFDSCQKLLSVLDLNLIHRDPTEQRLQGFVVGAYAWLQFQWLRQRSSGILTLRGLCQSLQ